MKVSELRLKNIRCFEDLTLELNGKSAILIGDNGDGKSTVLHSLAMSLVDQTTAAALLRKLYGATIRKGSDFGRIDVELNGETGRYSTQTKIRPVSDRLEGLSQKLYQLRVDQCAKRIGYEDYPWEQIFVVGYGSGIRVRGNAEYGKYDAFRAVRHLFINDLRLQNPELALWRLVAPHGRMDGSGEPVEAFMRLLETLLELDSGETIALSGDGLMIKNDRGQCAMPSAGDGRLSTVTWVIDMLTWWSLRGSGAPTNVSGIVLIDDLEKHLHPRLQRNIVHLLTESFPDVQFIISTHSPLVASGCEGIQVHRLNEQSHEVVEPFGWRAEEVYGMMGLESSRAEGFMSLLDEFKDLDEKRLRAQDLSEEEDKRFKDLYERLERMPGTDPVRLMTRLENLADFARECSGSSARNQGPDA